MKNLNSNAFEEIIENDEQTCLVIFSRKTCHVCQAVHKTMDELEKEYPDFPFYHVDAEEEPGLLEKYGLKGVPQVLFFEGGAVNEKMTGEHTEDEYAEKIEELS